MKVFFFFLCCALSLTPSTFVGLKKSQCSISSVLVMCMCRTINATSRNAFKLLGIFPNGLIPKEKTKNILRTPVNVSAFHLHKFSLMHVNMKKKKTEVYDR